MQVLHNETYTNWTSFSLEDISKSHQFLYNISNTTITSFPATDAALNAYMMYFIAVAIFGFFANLYVITVIILHKPMHKQMVNIYITNQSILDASACVILFFMTLNQNSGSDYIQGNLADEALCHLWHSQLPLYGLLDSSTYNILALTLERYIAIVHPIWHKTKFSNNKLVVGLSVAFVWFIGTAFNAVYLIPTSGIDETGICNTDGDFLSTTSESVYGVFNFCFEFGFPIVVIFFGYGSIIWALRRQVKIKVARNHVVNTIRTGIGSIVEEEVAGERGKCEFTGAVAQGGNQNTAMTKAMRNILMTSLIIAVFFILSWSLDDIYYLALNLGNPCCTETGNFYQITSMLVCLNCCINPVVYSLTYTEFKKGAVDVFGRIKTALATCTVDINTSSSQRS